MTVHVVMMGDCPDAAFRTRAKADAYVAEREAEDDRYRRVTAWRIYEVRSCHE